MSATYSPVESERFGISVGRVLFTADADAALTRDQPFDLLIARCPTDKIRVVQMMEASGFRLMDTLVYYRRQLNNIPDVPGEVHLLEPRELESVVEITRQAFLDYDGHYHADPRLPNELSDEGYVDWVRRSDRVLVSRTEGEVSGFITLRNDESEGEGLVLAVSPKFQGRGVGKSLMIAALWQFKEAGCKTMAISTQITNLRSQGLWSGLGFRLAESFYTFHRWKES